MTGNVTARRRHLLRYIFPFVLHIQPSKFSPIVPTLTSIGLPALATTLNQLNQRIGPGLLAGYLQTRENQRIQVCECAVSFSIFFSDIHIPRAPKLKQIPITAYTRKVTAPSAPLPVTKEGIKEHMLAVIATCDLVRCI